MGKIEKIIIIIYLMMISLVLSLIFVSTAMQTVFFDRFTYQKDAQYGYWPKKLALDNYDKYHISQRRKDVELLIEISSKKASVSEDFTDKFNVAIIGDSNIWGQGILNRYRLSTILEKKLNKYAPTKVYSFAVSGDNILDNFSKYNMLEKYFPKFDVIIFGLASNDILVNENPRYEKQTYEQEISKCKNSELFIEKPINQPSEKIKDLIKKAIKHSSANYCILNNIAKKLPKHAIYFNFDIEENRPTSHAFPEYTTILKKNDLYVVDVNDFIPTSHLTKNQVFVSKHEQHPSRTANKYYSAALEKLILEKYLKTNNPQP